MMRRTLEGSPGSGRLVLMGSLLVLLFAGVACAAEFETKPPPPRRTPPQATQPVTSAQSPSATSGEDRFDTSLAARPQTAEAKSDSPGAGPTLRVRASRTRCVAPCPVLFDATDTSDPGTDRPFEALHYVWNFDDDPSEVWSISGKSKNHAIGAIAGHVYTRAGRYGPRVSVSNRMGGQAWLRLEIEVTDPDVVFASTATTCVSTSGNFEGCPSGAKHVTSSNATGSLQNRDRRRTLLRRGEQFGGAAIRLVDAGQGEAILGAYGEGPKPLLAGVSLFGNRGWRVMDIHMLGPGANPRDRAFVGQPVDFTIFRVDVDRWNACIAWSDHEKMLTGNAVIDFSCDDFARSGGTASKIFENSSETLWMGMHIDLGDALEGRDEFNMRSVYTFKEVIQHSRFEGSPENRNVLQLRGCFSPGAAWCQPLQRPSKYLIFSDNHIIEERRTGSIIKTTHVEGGNRGLHGNANEDFIFERNLIQVDNFEPMDPLQRVFELQATQATIRSNVFDLQKMPLGGKHKVLVATRESEVPGIDQGSIRVLNNTIYLGRDFDNEFTICSSNNLGSRHVCMNNLVYAPGMRRKLHESQGTGWTAGNNLLETDAKSPFVGPPPGHLTSTLRKLDGFRLASGARANASGYDFRTDPRDTGDAVSADIFGGCPRDESRLSIGAHQPGAADCFAATLPRAPAAN